MSIRENTGVHKWPTYAVRTGMKAWEAIFFGGLQGDECVQESLPWTDDAYGWGGHEHLGTSPGCDNTPIVFVRGNFSSAEKWKGHAEYFMDKGYKGDELWAIDFPQSSPSHVQMAQQLDRFVGRVRSYTGCNTVNIVAYSLGVTGARYWLSTWGRLEWVDTFVGLAGANHGTAANLFSPVDDDGMIGFGADGRPKEPLQELNQFGETPGEVEYYTIRGSFDEYFFINPRSPELAGAENVCLPCDHAGVRDSLDTLEYLHRWLK